MTISTNQIFNYIDIVGDEYILKRNTPLAIKYQIKQYIENVEKLYDQKIKIKNF
jgi:hypothetical protein